MHATPRKALLGLLIALIAFATAAPASATNVLDMIVVEGAGTDSEVVLACKAPFFTNCSVALAFLASGSVNLPMIGTQTLSAWVGGVGGLSSVSNLGGEADGRVNAALPGTYCEWPGFSGGCLATQGAVDLGCDKVTAEGSGRLRLVYYNDPTVDREVWVIAPGPHIGAVAGEDCAPKYLCSEIFSCPQVPTASSPEEAEETFKDQLLAALPSVRDLASRLKSETGVQFSEDDLDLLVGAMQASVEQISVNANYTVSAGGPVSQEIRISVDQSNQAVLQ